MPAIDPSFLTTGPEWSVEPLAPGGAGGAPQPEGPGFGELLGAQVERLTGLQEEAAQASQALATGQATDPTSVVMSVERARLAMQLASQLRTKGVEAVNDIFHTQV
ncbi:MAG: flagellar hook-basal body complex protein FliE [Actinomycetota bacterium]|jgi:flagellar hook-basal body complex protein FliE|nr:flagellar hook-basal body complex protein FliE [Actinomycetota bacterium]